jgi:hypothetical protein
MTTNQPATIRATIEESSQQFLDSLYPKLIEDLVAADGVTIATIDSYIFLDDLNSIKKMVEDLRAEVKAHDVFTPRDAIFKMVDVKNRLARWSDAMRLMGVQFSS